MSTQDDRARDKMKGGLLYGVPVVPEADYDELKCCGNCNNFDIHHDPYGECEQYCEYLPRHDEPYEHDWHLLNFEDVQPWEHCHWKPSGWKLKRL